MRAHLKYLRYVLRHKWYVLLAGLKTRAPLWRLLIHDLSKFSRAEWGPYVDRFYKPKERGYPLDMQLTLGAPSDADAERINAARAAAFDRAWLHHQHANPHHWQHWLLLSDQPDQYPYYRIVSQDGGLLCHALAECTGPSDELRADFTDCLAVTGGDAAYLAYGMVARCVRAANARRPVALPMPEHFVREMVADWAGAGRAITGRWEAALWYAKNRKNIVLHPETEALVERLLATLQFG